MVFDPKRTPVENILSMLAEAHAQGVPDAEAMSLATSSRQIPNVRIVLFKGIYKGKLGFFTNYKSQKSKELALNPKAALCFFWPKLHQQIRIRGTVKKLSGKESDEYFSTRPRLSQLGAWASLQSSEITDYEHLQEKISSLDIKFKGAIPRPKNWGGFGLDPQEVEFWFGKEGRLHERFLFKKSGRTRWKMSLLSP
jgi:pyridoxamine 5'-phosphate oxidase